MTKQTESEIVTYNFDLQTIEFVSEKQTRFYTKASVSNLIGFLIFLVKGEKFKVIIEKREFIVIITYDSIAGWFATTDNFDGPEDKINSNWSSVGREGKLVS